VSTPQYPPQYPQFPQQYPPYGPPPKRRKVWPWVVFPLVVVLVAGAVVVALVLSGDGDKNGGPGGGQAGGGCTGQYCVGGFPFVNACRVLPPDRYPGIFGPMGTTGQRIMERYADPLPPSDTSDLPTWTYGVRADCDSTAIDSDAPLRHVGIHLDEQNSTKDIKVDEGDGDGQPLQGAPEALIFDQDAAAEVHWVHVNVKVTIQAEWGHDGTPVSHAAFAEAVQQVNNGIDHPQGEQQQQPKITQGGTTVIDDACAVFTGADFQKAVGYVVDPSNVVRGYTTPPDSDEFLGTTCTRTTTSQSQGFPAPPGTTFLDGGMSPDVSVRPLGDAEHAKAALADDKDLIDGVQPVPGLGDVAVFGTGSSAFYTLEFVKGFTLVKIDCGTTVGNKDWTAADMRAKLTPIAKAILARMR
jgi:hypothetical protein